MSDYQRHAIRGSTLTLLAAALAYAAAFVAPPGPDAAAALAIGAVVLLAAYYLFDRPDAIAGAWVVPTAAAAVVLLSESVHEQRVASLVLAALSVVGFVTHPLTARAAEWGARVGGKRE